MLKKLVSVILIIAIFIPAPALAIGLIRDAEIEKTLKDYGTPVWREAGIDPDAMRIYIVNDPSINAFTIGGLTMFLNTGLILKTDNSNMVIGVMAHETGHIAGGHIVKRMGEIDDLNVETILSLVLGAAVSVAGLPEAGMAVLAGGQQVAERNYMSYSRQQEVAADAAAIKFLTRTHQSAKGMLRMFEILRRDETLNYGTPDPYAISHPLSEERIGHIRAEAEVAEAAQPDKYAMQHARMVAKLYGFLEKPESTFLKYSDDSVPSIYARSIAYFRQSNFPKAFGEIDRLIAAYPNDAFFNELKGQFLSDSGHTKAAIPYYQKADKLYPNSSLIKNELGKILLGEGRDDEALVELTQATKLEPTNGETWRLLATVYGKRNNEPMSDLMLAEEALTMDKITQAKQFAKRAKDKLPKNSPAWLRANDLLADIKLNKRKDSDEEQQP